MTRFTSTALLIVIVISTQACLFDINRDEEPGEPFITGIITEIEQPNQRILIEENPDVNGPLEEGGNKIWLSVETSTKLFRDENGFLSRCEFSCFTINCTVSAWVTGAVAESYPLQGTADRIVILDD